MTATTASCDQRTAGRKQRGRQFIAPASVSKFPWEPEEDDDDDDAMITIPKANTNKSDDSKETKDRQLDFLASMTFANGGIRAPSCPCCI